MIYLDHNATSPMHPEVRAAMEPWWGVPANPASAHRAGQRAAMAVERAREQVAALIGANPDGVVFTSGATEANHTFVRGAVERARRAAPGASHSCTLSAIEHPCVQAAVARSGAERHLWGVESSGIVRVEAVPAHTRLISFMAANHETGVIQPIALARAAARDAGALLHVDATQAAGKMLLDLSDVDGVALSSHKLGGPAGVGALVLRDGEPFPGIFSGGSQERGRRAGTVNVAGVVGFGAACQIAAAELLDRTARWIELSAQIERGIRNLGGRFLGSDAPRLPNTTCAVFSGLRGETVVQALDLEGVCASSGAACASGSLEASPVLRAMGDPEPHGGVRFSLGWCTQNHEVEQFLALLPVVIERARLVAAFD
jgi:cysteine desulfurase